MFYSKTVLGCKENRRYEMGVQKIVFLRHSSSIHDFPATSHCFAIIIFEMRKMITEIASELAE